MRRQAQQRMAQYTYDGPEGELLSSPNTFGNQEIKADAASQQRSATTTCT